MIINQYSGVENVDAGKPQSEHGSSRFMVRRGPGHSGIAVLVRAHVGQ